MINKISIFQWTKIRKTIHNNEWWFVVEDVVSVLTESVNVKDYIKKMKKRDDELGKGWGQIVTPLAIKTAWWEQKINCANTEWCFRIIQSIPSPRAEPFKKWLAKVWYERVQEIEDPELAMKRMRKLYEQKWYPKDWIDKRERWIAIRNTLTWEWQDRGVQEWLEYAILTDEIYQATFWMKSKQYKTFKWLKRKNLRDHMTDLELIFNMLWEASTTEIFSCLASISSTI